MPLKLNRPPRLHDDAHAALFFATGESRHIAAFATPRIKSPLPHCVRGREGTMNTRRRKPRSTAVALAAAAGLTLAGCSSATHSGDEASRSASTFAELREGMINVEPASDPVDGGEFTFGAYSEPRSLDPAETIAGITTGGVEMINIYDSLIRFDAEAAEFMPQMSESLEHDDDHRVWTLTLRDNVNFSNGDPVNAEAVKASQERYEEKKGPEAGLWIESVAEISTPDERTVVYKLNNPWPEFPGILTTGPGMIVASVADGPGDTFTPIGAGPFTFESWSQAVEMTLAANENYWAGRPHLDSFRTVYLPDAQTSLDTLLAGGIDASFVREPNHVEDVLERGMSGYVNLAAAQNAAIINAAEGRPGADRRVRQAIQMAVNTETLRERVYDGYGLADSTLFPEYSRWHTETSGLPYDPDAARQLLEAAKADGYDGKLEYIKANSPTEQQNALTFQAMLETVGFEVEINMLPSVNDQIRLIAVDQDYDVAGWGMSFREEDPYSKMFAKMDSEGTQIYGMYTSPEMDALLAEFQQESDLDTKRDTMDRIQQQINQDVPFLVYAPYAEFVAWGDDVHGVVGSAQSMILLGKAWKD